MTVLLILLFVTITTKTRKSIIDFYFIGRHQIPNAK